MFDYAVRLAYDGTNYCGWQRQRNGVCVQERVEEALDKLEPSARHILYGAGRTDKGVHAWGQIAHFQMWRYWEPRRLLLALDARLPDDISAMCVIQVPQDFHARYSAQNREYLYALWNGPVCYPHIKRYVHWLPGQRDWKLAQKACHHFLGEHDFRSFARQNPPPKTSIRTITKARLIQKGSLVLFRVEANGFLTYMVRIMMGCLVDIASSTRDAHWLAEQIRNPQTQSISAKVPASGLHFWRVGYPDPIGMRLQKTQNQADEAEELHPLLGSLCNT